MRVGAEFELDGGGGRLRVDGGKRTLPLHLLWIVEEVVLLLHSLELATLGHVDLIRDLFALVGVFKDIEEIN
jgi:hypothetical protein